MEVFNDIIQGTDTWFSLRCGVPTASEAPKVMAKTGPRGGKPIGRTKYLNKLAAERITGIVENTYSNAHMDRGTANEAQARSLYEFTTGNDVEQVGFIKNGEIGGSPDGLVGDRGMIEIKDAIGSVQIERLLVGKLPPEHKPQCQALLMISAREWIDFVSHSVGLPILIVRVERDEKYIAGMRVDFNMFVDELNKLVETIRGM